MSLSPNVIALALFAIGLIAAARLLWKRPQRWPWRLLLQSLALLLVYMVLNPPPQPLPQAGTLTVLGENWRSALEHAETRRADLDPPGLNARLGPGIRALTQGGRSEGASEVVHGGQAADQDPPYRNASVGREPPYGEASVGQRRRQVAASADQDPPYVDAQLRQDPYFSAASAGQDPPYPAASAQAVLGPRAAVIALPEAEEPLPAGVQRAPDLAAALRLRPEFTSIRLIGTGLPLRDLDAARGRMVELVATPLPRGFVSIEHASVATLGGPIEVIAAWSGLAPTRVQLLDAAGEVLAEQSIDALGSQRQALADGQTASGPNAPARPDAAGRTNEDSASRPAESTPAKSGTVGAAAVEQEEAAAGSSSTVGKDHSMHPALTRLRTPARAPGTLALRLRALDAEDQVLGEHALHIEVLPPRALKTLLLAAAPGPETRALRRWAVDAGLDFDSRIQFAPGLVQGGRSLPPSAEELESLDLLIIEERAWTALGPAGRGAVLAAVDEGLGLLLRLSALPNPAVLAELHEAGFTIQRQNGETTAQAALASAPTRLRRLPISVESPQSVRALEDHEGAPLGRWRARGLGRFGLLWLTDSYRLQAAGHGDAYAALWSDFSAALARAPEAAPPTLSLRLPQGQTQAWAGERIEVCGLNEAAQLLSPTGEGQWLASPDSRGCSAALASAPGDYSVGVEGAEGLRFTVLDPMRQPALRAFDLHARTLALLSTPPAEEAAVVSAPGSFLPWLLALLGTLGLLWWLERPRALHQ